MDALKKTPLYSSHIALGGRMVEFGGWELPVQYSSILEEHRAVREHAGIFDVSHMGEISVTGTEALAYIQNLLTNDFTGMADGRCRYSPMCYENGGTVDDVIVYKFADDNYLIVVNASNADKDYSWMLENSGGFNVSVKNTSADWAQIALQGPKAESILAPMCDLELPAKNYTFVPELHISGIPAVVSRTGYTGEDGFELYCAVSDAKTLHAILLEAGKPSGLLPCGLGARDTLRFEASMPLYGHELSERITPLEAGLQFAVKLNKPEFIGRNALLSSPLRMRVGLRLTGKGIAREHTEVFVDGRLVGMTTSGGTAPTLGGSYAMALIDADASDAYEFDLIVRGREIAAERTQMPFYKRAK